MGPLFPQDIPYQIHGKLIVSGGNRSVRRKDTPLTDRFDVSLIDVLQIAILFLSFQQCQNKEGGVSLVHVIGFHISIS